MCGLRRDFEIRQNLIFKGNTAQFPPCGLSTAPAAAALRIMRYCPKEKAPLAERFPVLTYSLSYNTAGTAAGKAPWHP